MWEASSFLDVDGSIFVDSDKLKGKVRGNLYLYVDLIRRVKIILCEGNCVRAIVCGDPQCNLNHADYRYLDSLDPGDF
jgi:hypothetical protein